MPGPGAPAAVARESSPPPWEVAESITPDRETGPGCLVSRPPHGGQVLRHPARRSVRIRSKEETLPSESEADLGRRSGLWECALHSNLSPTPVTGSLLETIFLLHRRFPGYTLQGRTLSKSRLQRPPGGDPSPHSPVQRFCPDLSVPEVSVCGPCGREGSCRPR